MEYYRLVSKANHTDICMKVKEVSQKDWYGEVIIDNTYFGDTRVKINDVEIIYEMDEAQWRGQLIRVGKMEF